MKTQDLFQKFRELHLPLAHYALMGSAPLGIRNIREIEDLDMVVSPTLQKQLAKEYGIKEVNGVQRIVFPHLPLEAYWEGSFLGHDPNAPTISEILAQAEVIQDISFGSLQHVLYYKRKMQREKDLKDLVLIEKWLKENP